MKNTKKLLSIIAFAFAMLILSNPAMVHAESDGYMITIGTKEKTRVVGYTREMLVFNLEKVDNLLKQGWEYDYDDMGGSKVSMSGNKKVIGKEYGQYYFKKNGTAKVKVTYYLVKGKKKKKVRQTFKLKMVSFNSPFKKFAINGHSLMNQIKMPKDKYRYSILDYELKKGKKNKVTYALNKNWKIKKVTCSESGKKVKNIKMKNGINFAKGGAYCITVQNKKTKVIETYYLDYFAAM